MSTSHDLPTGRFRGVLVWIDDEARRVRHAPVTRANLRNQALSLEFTCDGRSYNVSLRESGGDYAGEWTRSVPAGRLRGDAICRVRPPAEANDDDAEGAPISLEGRWHEDGHWDWVARLRPLGSAEPDGTPG